MNGETDEIFIAAGTVPFGSKCLAAAALPCQQLMRTGSVEKFAEDLDKVQLAKQMTPTESVCIAFVCYINRLWRWCRSARNCSIE